VPELDVSAARAIRKNGAEFRVAADDRYREFWDWFESPDWEPDTVAVFKRFLGPETNYLDLGAWIGPTVLLAGPTVHRIVCVEPDPVAREALERNLELNREVAGKTTVLAAAAAAADGTAVLASPGGGGDSHSSLVGHTEAETRWSVPTISVAKLWRASGLAGPDFVKIDIEGAEYEIVPALESVIRSDRPTIYLATHPNLLLDKTSLRRRVRTALRALLLNRRMLSVLRTFRRHYVYDEPTGRLKDIRTRNVLRVFLPLPIRASFLIGACLFTDLDAD
jgi:FkbM family methyltransferase